MLVIELDGQQHKYEENVEYDCVRTQILNGYGISVLRFDNNQLEKNIDAVMAELLDWLNTHPTRPPLCERLASLPTSLQRREG